MEVWKEQRAMWRGGDGMSRMQERMPRLEVKIEGESRAPYHVSVKKRAVNL